VAAQHAHQIWGKFSMLDAEVIDNFILGFDNGSIGDTRVYVPTFGHTWTLSPTMVLDSNFGMNRQDQFVTGPDYGQNIGLDLGIPGTNGPDIRQSGMPHLRQRLQHRHDARLDAALPQGDELHVQHGGHQARAATRSAAASTSCGTS
jgi:hypothetical protein